MSREHRRKPPGTVFGDAVQRTAIAPGKRTPAQGLSRRSGELEGGEDQRTAPYRAIEFHAASWDIASSDPDSALDTLDAVGTRVQRNGTMDSEARVDVPATAATGLVGAPTALPHYAAIQKAFGHHDVSVIEAHVGGPAATAATTIGAEAYAMGNHVAFAGAPSPHTAAHEAAHVVQQRRGVHLEGGIGATGDRYERQADTVADAVVAGRSAESLLDETAGGNTTTALQRKDAASVPSPSYEPSSGRWPHEVLQDEASRDAEPTAAIKERQYKEAGATTIGDGRYRFWGFDVDSAVPRDQFAALLNNVAEQVRSDPEATIIVTGHTSASGTEAHNVGLSSERAVALENELKLRGAVAGRYFVTGEGEATPIADETKGPSAMARNRRVEIEVIPGPEEAEPQQAGVGTNRGAPALGCNDLSLMIKLNKAEIIAWTMVETSGQSHGTPRLTLPDENVNQPTLVDWRTACRSAGIRDDDVIDSYYDNVKLPIGTNLLAHKRELERQIAEYERLIRDPDGCDPNKPLDTWFSDPDHLRFGARIRDKEDLDRMPGDVDPKGRRY